MQEYLRTQIDINQGRPELLIIFFYLISLQQIKKKNLSTESSKTVFLSVDKVKVFSKGTMNTLRSAVLEMFPLSLLM